LSKTVGINPLVTNRYVGQFINEITAMGKLKLKPSQDTTMLTLADCFEVRLNLSSKIYRARTGDSIGEFANIATEALELCKLLVIDQHGIKRLEEWVRLFNQLDARELIDGELDR
jgi:hypothetical protein